MANIFNEEIEGVKALIGLIGDLKKDLKGLVVQTQKASESMKFDNVEDIKKVDEAIKDVAKSEKELIKIKQEETKLNITLEKLQQEEVKTLKTLKQIEEQSIKQKKAEAQTSKANIQTLREAEKLQQDKIKTQNALLAQQKKLQQAKEKEEKQNNKIVSQYEKLSKQLRDNKNEYKELVLQGKKTDKSTENLRKQIVKLDKELRELDSTVGDSYREIGKYENAVNKLETDLTKLAVTAGATALSLETLDGVVQSNEESSESFRKISAGLGAATKEVGNRTADTALDIFDFGKALFSGDEKAKSLLKNMVILGTGLNKVGVEFDKTAEGNEFFTRSNENAEKSIIDVIAANIEAETRLIALEKVSRKYAQQVAQLNGVIDEENAKAGDTTRGMESIADSINLAIAAEVKRNKILLKQGNEELAILKARRVEGQKNLALDNEISEKKVELIELENDLNTSLIEQQKELNLNDRDIFEKKLDYALDLFDTQKTLNERGIADENKTFEERKSLLARTNELANKAFKEQQELAEEQVGQKLNLNKLIAEDDQAVIYEKINAATQDEIVQQRILDIIRDRKTAVLDLAEAERELNKQLVASQQAEYDAAFELEKFKQESALREEKDATERYDKELVLIQLRYDKLLEAEGLLESEKKLLKLKRQEEEDAAEKKFNESKLEDQKKYAKKSQEIIAGIADIQREAFNERQTQLDEEISASETQQARLLALADKGSEDAINNLASEQKREAELRKQKQQEIQEQKRTELLFTALDTYAGHVANGKTGAEAVGSTITDIALLSAAIKSLPFFKDGTEDTGTASNPLDSDGGRLAVLHDNERVIDKSTNLKMKGITNGELGNLAESFKRGELVNAEQQRINVISSGGSYMSNAKVLSELSEINKTLSELPRMMPDTGLTVDTLGGIMTLTKSQEGIVNKTNFKINGRKSWS